MHFASSRNHYRQGHGPIGITRNRTSGFRSGADGGAADNPRTREMYQGSNRSEKTRHANSQLPTITCKAGETRNPAAFTPGA